MSGMAAGMVSGACVYEQNNGPGGICRSYYLRPGDSQRYDRVPPGDDAYRFEVGGGHWIFGGDPEVLGLLEDLAPMNSYERRALVKIAQTTIPYPLQEHIALLGHEIAKRVAVERSVPVPELTGEPTLERWLESRFGDTLNELFFLPFNRRYTAGLSARIVAEDAYKSPVTVRWNTSQRTGYNGTFRYPIGGLDVLATAMAARCDVRYGKRVVAIESGGLRFDDGTETQCDTVISTIPLDRAVDISGIDVGAPSDPFTSVLVLNVGAERGPRCPDAHWQYEPDSESGFHRIGFYSHVDRSFLPGEHRARGDRVALYIEKAYLGGEPPTSAEAAAFRESAIGELRERQYIGAVEVIDTSWVETAYTWRLPGSSWRRRALDILGEHRIFQTGRYGTWRFQGIADSVRDGLALGGRLRAGELHAGRLKAP